MVCMVTNWTSTMPSAVGQCLSQRNHLRQRRLYLVQLQELGGGFDVIEHVVE
jgi:hypothetical protein